MIVTTVGHGSSRVWAAMEAERLSDNIKDPCSSRSGTTIKTVSTLLRISSQDIHKKDWYSSYVRRGAEQICRVNVAKTIFVFFCTPEPVSRRDIRRHDVNRRTLGIKDITSSAIQLRKLWTDFYETWQMGWTCARDEPMRLWDWSGPRPGPRHLDLGSFFLIFQNVKMGHFDFSDQFLSEILNKDLRDPRYESWIQDLFKIFQIVS